MDNKNYLILGGTGAMGAYLTTILAKLGGVIYIAPPGAAM